MAIKQQEAAMSHIMAALNAADKLEGMDVFAKDQFREQFTLKYNGYAPDRWGCIKIFWDFKDSKFSGDATFGRTIFLGEINPRTMKKAEWVSALVDKDLDEIHEQLKLYVKGKVAKNRRALTAIHTGSAIDEVRDKKLRDIGAPYSYITRGYIQPESVPDCEIKDRLMDYLRNNPQTHNYLGPFYEWDGFKAQLKTADEGILSAFDAGNMYEYFGDEKLTEYVDSLVKEHRGEQPWFHQLLELDRVKRFSKFKEIIDSHECITVTDRVLELIADKFTDWFDVISDEAIHQMIRLRDDSFDGKVLIVDETTIKPGFQGDCIYVGITSIINGVESTFDPHVLKQLQARSYLSGINVWYTDALIKQAETFYSLLGAESPTVSIPADRIIQFDSDMLKLFGSHSSPHRNWFEKETLVENYGLITK